jgi:(p)ppGpp synthase/HD superfamily hydrolase
MAREHATQRDKGGKPYIYHTLAVALEILKADGTEEEVSAGMLHDVVEDTPTTSDSLRHVIGLSETTVDAVVSVTKVEGEARADYIDRLAKNKTGRRVKIADLRNNMDITRLKNRGSLTEKDLQRIKVYGEEYDFLVGGQVGV